MEYGSSLAGHARLRDRALALRHGLQHEPRAPEPRAQDRVRAPRRRRPPHGLHHLPDLPRSHAPRPVRRQRLQADRRGRAVPPPGLRGARALLRGPVRLARHGLHLGPRHAGPARPPHRLRGRLPGGARPLRLPAVLAARQRHLLAQGRSRRAGAFDRRGGPRARADHARGRRRRGVPRGARRDRDVGPLADHGRDRRSTSRRCSRTLRVLTPGDVAPTEAELAACPSARSAMVYALDEARRERARSPSGRHAVGGGRSGSRRHARGR